MKQLLTHSAIENHSFAAASVTSSLIRIVPVGSLTGSGQCSLY